MRPITVSIGYQFLTPVDPVLVRTALPVTGPGPLVLNGTGVVNGVAMFLSERNVLFTFSSAENIFLPLLQITGFNSKGAPVSETIFGPQSAGTVLSVNQYFKVTSVYAHKFAAGTVSIGTSAIATSPWVAFDTWSPGDVAIQVNVVSAVNYTVQSTLDDVNDVTNAALWSNPNLVTWVNTNDTVMVNATASAQSNFLFVPSYARVLLNSGAGLVTATFTQSGAS